MIDLVATFFPWSPSAWMNQVMQYIHTHTGQKILEPHFCQTSLFLLKHPPSILKFWRRWYSPKFLGSFARLFFAILSTFDHPIVAKLTFRRSSSTMSLRGAPRNGSDSWVPMDPRPNMPLEERVPTYEFGPILVVLWYIWYDFGLILWSLFTLFLFKPWCFLDVGRTKMKRGSKRVNVWDVVISTFHPKQMSSFCRSSPISSDTSFWPTSCGKRCRLKRVDSPRVGARFNSRHLCNSVTGCSAFLPSAGGRWNESWGTWVKLRLGLFGPQIKRKRNQV